mmetsp:Transcript_6587/g.9793  ORF Transcript_6587/g.9793 Transcript_6587/m.9793 type:complete len:669 (+) Transcript_6587:204-2210(+)
MSWDDVVDGEVAASRAWPTLDEVTAYRASVRQLMLDIIRSHPALENAEPSPLSARWCVALICEHERIHLETSSVLIRELDASLVKRPQFWPLDHPSVRMVGTNKADKIKFVPFSPTSVSLGKPEKRGITFGWDNEYGHREINVNAFESSATLITNGQFLDFVKDGGYARSELWTQDGWGWRSFRNRKWPHFWLPRGPSGLHEYGLRLPFEELDSLPMQLPAEVNAHEARAFCKWLQLSNSSDGWRYGLCTEAQHGVLKKHDISYDDSKNPALYGSEDLRSMSLNLNLAYGSPSAVDSTFMGNVWHWCEDDFSALPGFAPEPLYDDFSTPCFDGQHSLILGGSFVSTGDEASAFARFHFRPHFHQHAGFRVTRQRANMSPPELSSYDAPPPHAQGWVPIKYADLIWNDNESESTAKYESQTQLAAYLDLHFAVDKALEGPALSQIHILEPYLDFPKRCAKVLTNLFPSDSLKDKNALDVGCAVGGTSFALADAGFAKVVGIDFSEQFINIANKLAAGDPVSYRRSGIAGNTSPVTLKLRQRDTVSFDVADACDKSKLLAVAHSAHKFDAIVCANLLCRLPDPRAFVDSLPDITNPEAVILFVSPYSWFTEYTPDTSKWYRGPSDIEEHMSNLGFELIYGPEEMPLLIRDHERKFQVVFSNALGFRRRTL